MDLTETRPETEARPPRPPGLRKDHVGPRWCEVHDGTGEPDAVCHFSTPTEHKLSIEDGAASVSLVAVTSDDPALQEAGGVELCQRAGIDGIRLTASEAITLGADLIRHGEQLQCEDEDCRPLPPQEAGLSDRWMATIDPVTDVLARIDMDRLMDHFDEASKKTVDATLSDLIDQAGLTWECGIGAKIAYIVDMIMRDGCLIAAAWAATRLREKRPDLHDGALSCVPMLARSVMLRETLSAKR